MDHTKNCDWFFTGVYSHLEVEKRRKFWNLLCSLHNQVGAPFLIVGNLNEIFYHRKKKGNWVQVEKQLEDFRDTLIDYELHELGFLGTPFTWSNGREGRDLINERLDRCMTNLTWCDLLSNSRVTHGSMVY